MTELINKLPHGNTWWEFSNDKLIQTVSFNKDEPSDKGESSDKNESSTSNKNELPQKDKSPSIVNKPFTKHERGSNKNNKINLYDAIISSIDDLFPLYTENMQRDAKTILRTELKEFINHASFQKLFIGPKLRTLLSWLNGNKIEKSSMYIIIQFANWFTSTELIDENKSELKHMDKYNELYIVDKPE